MKIGFNMNCLYQWNMIFIDFKFVRGIDGSPCFPGVKTAVFMKSCNIASIVLRTAPQYHQSNIKNFEWTKLWLASRKAMNCFFISVWVKISIIMMKWYMWCASDLRTCWHVDIMCTYWEVPDPEIRTMSTRFYNYRDQLRIWRQFQK